MFPLIEYNYKIPKENDLGAWSVKRKYNCHEGVDLYAKKGQEVYAIEDGVIVGIENFTGDKANPPSPWWNNTIAILVKGKSGVILYGELKPNVFKFKIGENISTGDYIGIIEPVLKKDKGVVPSTSMLHIELYDEDTTQSVIWELDKEKPSNLRDITPLLNKELELKKEQMMLSCNILDVFYKTMSVNKELFEKYLQNMLLTSTSFNPKLKKCYKENSVLVSNNSDPIKHWLVDSDYVYLQIASSFQYLKLNRLLKSDNITTIYGDYVIWINKEMALENTKQNIHVISIKLDQSFLIDFNLYKDTYADIIVSSDFKNILFIGIDNFGQ